MHYHISFHSLPQDWHIWQTIHSWKISLTEGICFHILPSNLKVVSRNQSGCFFLSKITAPLHLYLESDLLGMANMHYNKLHTVNRYLQLDFCNAIDLRNRQKIQSAFVHRPSLRNSQCFHLQCYFSIICFLYYYYKVSLLILVLLCAFFIFISFCFLFFYFFIDVLLLDLHC